MAIISSGAETGMVVRYQIGMVNGTQLSRRKSVSVLKMDVSDQDLYKAAATLFDLPEYPLVSVTRNKTRPGSTMAVQIRNRFRI
ncbi:DUF1659 domain-containing protein [Desulfosporosinus youngiae]|uniref:DUF1659 domain-containing protein n=1 Tax=Desulfosporosinus youngiae DSM 17734 TaxID=768710 RepID=H5XSQ3_9FIRM|nr:DUF1659 domain-containing protein [Desulfosporosinus youngiae]EHQ87721.1 hypothetical protein DesyoDRAFT_0538 [Desulfosporosinus youngiae DSM 17734]